MFVLCNDVLTYDQNKVNSCTTEQIICYALSLARKSVGSIPKRIRRKPKKYSSTLREDWIKYYDMEDEVLIFGLEKLDKIWPQ